MLRSRTRAGRTSDPSSACAVATNEYLGALRGCAHINCLAKGSSESTSKVTGKQLRARAGVPRPSGAPFASRSDFGLSAGVDEESLWRRCLYGPAPRFGRAARCHSDEILFFTLQESWVTPSIVRGPPSLPCNFFRLPSPDVYSDFILRSHSRITLFPQPYVQARLL